jgi:hypothetical protein
MLKNWHRWQICLTFLVLNWPAAAQQASIEQISREFTRIVGPLTLFRVDEQFVLQPKFIDRNLSAIQCVPRYFFSDDYPEWTEPEDDRVTISVERYHAILARLERVKPIGAFHGEVTRSHIVMNLYSDSWEEFDSAIVLRGLYPPRGAQSYAVGLFRVWYLRAVEGKITFLDPNDSQMGRRVGVDGRMYWTTTAEFGRLKKDATVRFRAAGPIEAW